MDEPVFPTAGGGAFAPDPAGQACSWRLTSSDGVLGQGFAPGRGTDRRSAAFVAHVAQALERTRQRRF